MTSLCQTQTGAAAPGRGSGGGAFIYALFTCVLVYVSVAEGHPLLAHPTAAVSSGSGTAVSAAVGEQSRGPAQSEPS